MSVLLACALAAGTAVSPTGLVTVRAEEGEKITEDGLVYEDNEGICIIGYYGNATEIVIPEIIEGKEVTRIYGGAFKGCSSLESISIPSSVTEIGDLAFFRCSSLKSISIPSDVTKIGASAFSDTPWLEEQFKQNGGMAIVGHFVVDADNTISGSIVIPEGVTEITDQAFNYCSNLTGINIPSSVTEIGTYAFAECSSLESISIPSGVTEIGASAFAGCSSLESISIPSGVTKITDRTFDSCSNLTGISIPSSVTEIGELAFAECSSLESISIPSGVTEIGAYAFFWCSSLKSISIPSSVTKIGASAFSDTPWLEEQFKQNGGMAIVGHFVVDTDNTISGNMVIPERVTAITDHAFDSCSNLTGISIPSSVTEIGSWAFFRCSSLKNISIPSSVTKIGASAFSDTPWLEEQFKQNGGIAIVGHFVVDADNTISGNMVIPEGVTAITDQAFDSCSNLTSISIPSSVAIIGIRAFDNCETLKDVYYAGSQEQWKQIEIDNYNEFLRSAEIHYGSVGPSDSGSDGFSNSVVETVKKSPQSLMAFDIVKIYGTKAFSLGAKSSGGTALSYAVSAPKVASVDGNGNVTIKGCGITEITITAAETSTYEKVQKTIKLTVKPKTMTVSSITSKKKKTATVKWKKDKTATGYMIECATDKKFKKNKVVVTVSKYKTISTTVKKLKAGKKYYVRICAYAKSGSTNVQGNWSKAKKVKVKK